MKDRIIRYREIPTYSSQVDPKKRSVIALSRRQAQLAKWLIGNPSPQRPRLFFGVVDVVLHGILLFIIFFLARNLLLLGYFHGAYPQVIASAKYVNRGSLVLLILNASRASNWTDESDESGSEAAANF